MTNQKCNYCNMTVESEKRVFGDEIHINGERKMSDTIPKERWLETLKSAEKEVYSQVEYIKKDKIHRLRVWNTGIQSLDVDINYCPFCGKKL